MKPNLKQVASRVDYRRLSGVRSVLGIDLEPGSAFVAELRRRGNPFDAVSGKIEAVRSFRCTLRGETPEESAQALKSALSEFGVKTTYAVVSPKETRFVSTAIPPEVDNVTEWVEENAGSLLHLPIRPSELRFHIDTLGTEPSGRRLLVTVVRNGEVESTAKIAAAAGLTLLSIQPGLLGLIPVCALSFPGKLPREYRIAHLSQGTLSTLACEDGRVTGITVDHVAPDLSLPDALERSHEGQDGKDTRVFASGGFEKSNVDQALIRPFGFTSDFALASGLALSGILPHLSSANFLPRIERDGLELHLAKSLLKRAALVSGFTLLTALALPMALSGYVNMKSDALDESASGNRDSIAEFEAMERESMQLKESARQFALPESRSNSAYGLHEIAKQVPKDVRLLSLVMQNDGPNLLMKGEAESQKTISEFMKRLQGSPLCKELSLKRLDTGGAANGQVHARKGRVYFEIALQLVRGRSI